MRLKDSLLGLLNRARRQSTHAGRRMGTVGIEKGSVTGGLSSLVGATDYSSTEYSEGTCFVY